MTLKQHLLCCVLCMIYSAVKGERLEKKKKKVLKSKKRGIYIKIYNSDLLVGQQKQVQL